MFFCNLMSRPVRIVFRCYILACFRPMKCNHSFNSSQSCEVRWRRIQSRSEENDWVCLNSDELTGTSRTQIGFITFDQHNLKSSLSVPLMLLVTPMMFEGSESRNDCSPVDYLWDHLAMGWWTLRGPPPLLSWLKHKLCLRSKKDKYSRGIRRSCDSIRCSSTF